MSAPERSEESLLEFVAVMRRLRDECEWKRLQTHRSLTRYLLEETHELVEALDGFEGSEGDDELLREELGDVLLQVVFHAVIAEERGAFTMADVAADVTAKMVRRNPHVFGPEGSGEPAPSAAQVTESWERIKAAEKDREHLLDGIAPTLPALLLADKALERAERAGTPIPVDQDSSDLGERLLRLVAEARATGVDPEQALRDTVRRHTPHR